MRTCTGCHTPKPLDDFSPDPRTSDGRQARCKDCKKIAQGARYQANPEREKAVIRCCVAAKAGYYEDKARKRLARETASHPDRVKARVANKNHRRRARLVNAITERVTAAQWQSILEYFDHRCAYCLHRGEMEQDHIVALSLGGIHGVSNLVPACRSCNGKKSGLPLWRMV